jgi:hypothetical protein
MFYEDENEKAVVTSVGSIHIEQLNSWKPGIENHEIFNEDFCSMGTSLGMNVMMLHMHHPNSQDARYITLVHKPTGERIRITFPWKEEL